MSKFEAICFHRVYYDDEFHARYLCNSFHTEKFGSFVVGID